MIFVFGFLAYLFFSALQAKETKIHALQDQLNEIRAQSVQEQQQTEATLQKVVMLFYIF